MTEDLKQQLIEKAREKQIKTDPSHDINHVLRVLYLAEKIAEQEKADLDIIIPAACFHDIVIYPKNSPQNKNAADESAELTDELLKSLNEYPADKIEKVKIVIRQCSFSKGIEPDLLEAKILQDADRLEATGAISIMRTFSSGGQMNQKFYKPEDPFCEKGKPVDFASGLDLFYNRLLLVEGKMHTNSAKKIAKRRTEFLRAFLDETRIELEESGVINSTADISLESNYVTE